MDLSICIPTLNSRDFLQSCLQSIVAFPPQMEFELIVVDNASQDGTLEMLQQEFPQVKIIHNQSNLGFTRPLNQALHAAGGEFFLILNPDTKIDQDAFTPQVEFLRQNPQVGVSIPKILNADGTFQRQCRRGEARPAEVFGYFLGLGRLFPRNRALNGYLQAWLGEDEIAEVKAVSGSCIFLRRQTWEQVGDFDENLFAYQEDSDYCLRARKAGWKVMYVPMTCVTHFGGEGGSQTKPYNSIFQWHRSYYLYYRKHFAREYFFLFNGFYYLAMAIKLLLALIKRALMSPFHTEHIPAPSNRG